MSKINSIEGIRGIAVISVLLYHLDFSLFSSGFIGVDIFFVISGYLIIPKILSQIQNRDFEFKIFFFKRLRRLVPALLLVLVVAIIVGYFLLTPREYKELAHSILSNLIFSQNFFFRDRTGYFADLAHQKPLLHTWSLGVEMQFYLLVPLILLLINKFFSKKYFKAATFTLIAISLLISMYWSYNNNADKAFFFSITRFWEFAIGGYIAHVSRYERLSKNYKILIGTIGAFLLVTAIYFINQKAIFPGLVVILPVLATSLLILSSDKSDNIISKILSNNFLTYIGKISYSVYLVHWPIIVFTKISIARELYINEKIYIVFFTAILSIFIYRNIKLKTRIILLYVFIISFILFIFSFLITNKEGMPSRMTPEAMKIYHNTNKVIYSGAKCLNSINNITTKPTKYTACDIINSSEVVKRIFIIGDSHAGMFLDGIYYISQKLNYNLTFFGMPSCYPLINSIAWTKKNKGSCREFTSFIKDHIASNKDEVKIVIISARWANISSNIPAPGDGQLSFKLIDNDGMVTNLEKSLLETVQFFQSNGAKVLVVGPVPEISFHVPDTMIRAKNNSTNIPKILLKEFYSRQDSVLRVLTKVEKIPNTQVLYPHKEMCYDDYCIISKDGVPLYEDDDHLSHKGVQILIPEITKALRQ
jgi:peptidoglycan/LPS O-acetylase OafA/YrhL